MATTYHLPIKPSANATWGVGILMTSAAKQGALTVLGHPSSAANPLVFINDLRRAAAGGGRTLRVLADQKTNALTGTIEATYTRAQNHVASMTGKIVALAAYASNHAASAGGTVHGADIWALPKTFAIGTIRGAEIGLDFDGGETADLAECLLLTSQAGGTITAHWGLHVSDDSATTPGGRVFDGFIRFSKTATQSVKALLDSQGVVGFATSVGGVTLTTGDVPLLAYKDKDGTAHVLVLADNDTVAIRT